MRALFWFLEEIYCGFAALRFFSDFLCGSSVSNRPLSPLILELALVLFDFINCISVYPLNNFKHCPATEHEFHHNIVKVAVD